jgi:glycine dehydrogenase subunit 1
MSFTPHTQSDIDTMLKTIGVGSMEQLFQDIPKNLRAKDLNLPIGLSEFEVLEHINALAQKNNINLTSFLGGGFYRHYIPAAVGALSGRAEFYTAYTPYQAEASQGTLQALYEYQTSICRLTGMDVSNASMYDGGTALAEAALMCLRITRNRKKILMDKAINPLYQTIIRTYLQLLDVELITISCLNDKINREEFLAQLDENTAGILLQTPNFFGTIEDYSDIISSAHAKGALVAASVYPISLGLLESPGAQGIDIATGEGQSLGNPLNFGGPYFGFMATKTVYMRNLPGRIVGATVDKNQRRSYVLTLQAREQHIKRHRATSNICSNQSLCALRGLIYLSCLGKDGFKEIAQQNFDKAEFAKAAILKNKNIKLFNTGATFNEFVITLPEDASDTVSRLLTKGILAGIPLGKYYPHLKNNLLICVTETNKEKDISALAKILEDIR